MSKHLKSIIQTWKEKFEEETTLSLREDLEDQNREIKERLGKIVENQEEINKRMANNLMTIDKNQTDLKEKFDAYVENNEKMAKEDLQTILEK